MLCILYENDWRQYKRQWIIKERLRLHKLLWKNTHMTLCIMGTSRCCPRKLTHTNIRIYILFVRLTIELRHLHSSRRRWQQNSYPLECLVGLQKFNGTRRQVLRGDSLGVGPELLIINHVIICRWKRNLDSTYFGRCGGNWVKQDAEIGIPPPGYSGQYKAPRPRMLQATWQEELQQFC
jgi:hypothetical protein